MDKCLARSSPPKGCLRTCIHRDLYNLASTNHHMFDLVVDIAQHQFDDCLDDIVTIVRKFKSGLVDMQTSQNTGLSTSMKPLSIDQQQELLIFAINYFGTRTHCARLLLRALHPGRADDQLFSSEYPALKCDEVSCRYIAGMLMFDDWSVESFISEFFCVPCVLGTESDGGLLSCQHKRDCIQCAQKQPETPTFGPYAQDQDADTAHRFYHCGNREQSWYWTYLLRVEEYHESCHIASSPVRRYLFRVRHEGLSHPRPAGQRREMKRMHFPYRDLKVARKQVVT